MELILNKYQRIYFSLCSRAKDRNLVEYTEKHHIIPRCAGGTNTKDNLVKLTAREHYVAHLCLIRCTTGILQHSMAVAVLAFQRKNKRQVQEYKDIRFNSRIFQKLREIVAAEQSRNRKGDPRFGYWRGKSRSMETRQRTSATLKGRQHSKEHIQNQANSHRGTKHKMTKAGSDISLNTR